MAQRARGLATGDGARRREAGEMKVEIVVDETGTVTVTEDGELVYESRGVPEHVSIERRPHILRKIAWSETEP